MRNAQKIFCLQLSGLVLSVTIAYQMEATGQTPNPDCSWTHKDDQCEIFHEYGFECGWGYCTSHDVNGTNTEFLLVPYLMQTDLGEGDDAANNAVQTYCYRDYPCYAEEDPHAQCDYSNPPTTPCVPDPTHEHNCFQVYKGTGIPGGYVSWFPLYGCS